MRLAFSLCTSLLCLVAFSQQPPHSVLVRGQSIKDAIPDSAELNLEIVVISDSIAESQTENNKSTSNLLTRLVGLGVPEQDVALSGMSQGKHQVIQDNTYVQRGYFARKSVAIRLKRLSALAGVLDALSQDNNIELSQVVPLCSTIESVKEGAIRAALEEAQKKAILIATSYNMRVGQPIIIEEITESLHGSAYQVSGVALVKDSAEGVGSLIRKVPVIAEYDVTFQLIAK